MYVYKHIIMVFTENMCMYVHRCRLWEIAQVRYKNVTERSPLQQTKQPATSLWGRSSKNSCSSSSVATTKDDAVKHTWSVFEAKLAVFQRFIVRSPKTYFSHSLWYLHLTSFYLDVPDRKLGSMVRISGL